MHRLKVVLRLFLLLMAAYLLLRIIFALLYFDARQFGFMEWLQILYRGSRMDYAALFYINLPFLFLFFAMAFLPRQNWEKKIFVILFSLINLPFILLGIIDLVYFRYNLRRSTIDIVYSLQASTHSFGSLFLQYWYVAALALMACILFVFLCRRIITVSPAAGRRESLLKWLAPALFLALSFVVSRGLGSRPIGPSTPLLYFHPTAQPLVNNSSLNVLYSFIRAKSRLERKNYYSQAGLDSVFTIRRQYNADSSLLRKNVVVFVLESFSEAYFRPGPLRTRTPFLDSLRGKSRVFTSAFQNGHESTKGLLSILASMPPFLDEPLFISNYNAVPFDGIGTLLKNEGYTTNFFLGAEYDHFNFAKLCRMVGIDHYYSKDDYHHPENDDGNWGIYDEFFFSHFADVSAGARQPFFSVLYNISSHPPFKIPPARRAEFAIAGQDAQRNSISYVDGCFRSLFDKIRNQPWFGNSIFVFTADHSLLDNTGQASFLYESLRIPLFIYDPSDPIRREIAGPVQQMDIVPTIADMLHYPKPFMSFGNSMLRPASGYSISRTYGEYQLIDSAGITGFDENSGSVVFYYDWRNDAQLKNNLSADPVGKERGRGALIKGVLQRFNNSIIDEKLLLDN